MYCHGSYVVTFHTCLLPCECFHSHNQLCPMTTCVLFCHECHDMFMKIQFSFIPSVIFCAVWWRIQLFCCHFSIPDAAVTRWRKTYRALTHVWSCIMKTSKRNKNKQKTYVRLYVYLSHLPGSRCPRKKSVITIRKFLTWHTFFFCLTVVSKHLLLGKGK